MGSKWNSCDKKGVFMKKLWIIFLALGFFTACSTNNNNEMQFDEYPIYDGPDLGMIYTPKITSFRLWSPFADEVVVHFYENGEDGDPIKSMDMKKDDDGTWLLLVNDDIKGSFYTYQVKQNGEWLQESAGPYAKATGVNGQRAYVVDFAELEPENWSKDRGPKFKKMNDILIYELHVRDMSTHPSSGVKAKGTFKGLAEQWTKSPDNLKTGIDHMKELGITHVHILPAFDYRSIDERYPEKMKYNWGYDPQNYNVPEGSYATDPYNPTVRIKEMREMIKTFHDNGIGVILDVVYNHTGYTDESVFNLTVPGYYYRHNEDGSFSNASGCGNETASERPMMRKYILESIRHWADIYHIDGFRFDLMGIHDIETMNDINKELNKHPWGKHYILYGEGWTAGGSPLPVEQQAIKKQTYKLDGIAAFSDDLRDGVKGHWGNVEEKGFVSGKEGLEESIKFGVVGATQHPEIDYSLVNYSDTAWAPSPLQCINYVSCHDNNTLYDKLKISNPDASEEEIQKMHLLANTIVLTSQGVPFLHAGVEMMRTKQGVENSFESPDSINQIDWTWKKKHLDVFHYYQKLIQLRKNHPAFRMPDTEMISEHLHFLDSLPAQIVAYTIDAHTNEDTWGEVLVAFNGNKTATEISIPEGKWNIVLENGKIDEEGIRSLDTKKLTVEGKTAIIAVKE